VPDGGDVGGQPRDALVHILERLQVGQVPHQEEGVLERVLDRRSLLDDRAEQGLQ